MSFLSDSGLFRDSEMLQSVMLVSRHFSFLPYLTCNIGLSLVASEFPTRREQMYGYTEAAVGLGMMMGPAVG